MSQQYEDLKSTALEIRRLIVKMIAEAGSGHPGGSLSCTDILTALYFKLMNIDPQNPDMPGRDRLVLSKGHAAPALYATLAVRGYFPVEELFTLRKLNSRLQGHPDMTKTPGVEATTGSLGQGLSFANGLALAAKLANSDATIYCLLGDGEIDEGQIWEAAMSAAHYKLDNLIAILDYNRLQLDGPTSEIMCSDPVAEKFSSFGFEVIEIDGHSFAEIIDAVEKAKAVKGRPTLILAHTVKGKGVSFMENEVGWHGKAPNKEQLEQALAELN